MKETGALLLASFGILSLSTSLLLSLIAIVHSIENANELTLFRGKIHELEFQLSRVTIIRNQTGEYWIKGPFLRQG